jgi:protein-disulfide isomerase-like protein with CxxC motif
MTPSLLHAYEVLCAWLACYGYAPSVRELAAACGYPAHNKAWRRLDALRGRGLVVGTGRRMRAV